MNKFNFIIKSLFRYYKRTISLSLSYTFSIIFTMVAINFAFYEAEDLASSDIGYFLILIICLILSAAGLVSFIDTIIYQVKTWNSNQ